MERDERVRVEIQQTLGAEEEQAPGVGPVVGEIATVDAEGRASVVFPGEQIVPVAARCALSADAIPAVPFEELAGRPVLLVFEGGDTARPVIVGFVSETLPRPAQAGSSERLVLEGEEEVVLRCGKSTIVLKKDGRVLVRGTHLVSRSSGPNWIRGASVGLN